MEYQKLPKLAIGITVVFFLASCASGPTQEQLASANHGRDMSSEECRLITESFISNTLKDPSSAQFRHSNCSKGYWGSVPIKGMKVAFGWIQKGEVNGKNSFGGYVGFRSYQVLIKDGKVGRYCVSDKDGLCWPSSS
jgi:hypothetical protein